MDEQTYGSKDLSGKWKLRWADGQRGSAKLSHLLETDEDKWMETNVPSEIHVELIKAGLIQEPTEGLNALSGRWVEECLWSFRTTFMANDEAIGGSAWLYFAGLDYHAKIYLNEELIGEHANFFCPCRISVAGKLRKENLLVVVIDSGLFGIAEKPIEGYFENSADGALHKRIWLRKPQCSFGWDWSTRYVNVGIHKPVSLEWAQKARLDEVVILSDVSGAMDQGFITIRAFVEGLSDLPYMGKLLVKISGVESSFTFDVEIRTGMQRLEAQCRIVAPNLWWPAGHGNQSLYEVTVQLLVDNIKIGERSKRIGFRKLTINQDPHPSGGRYFYIEVNGRPTFAKGANFVPADMILIVLATRGS
jgi:beta-mannosidase